MGHAAAGPRAFDCLWCGRTWQPRTADDLEARARLCPDCLGKAGENPFLRFRLRAGLDERAAATAERGAGSPSAGAEPGPEPLEPDPDDLDAWYLRRGRHAHGPVHDLAWQMELDVVTTWLDGLPLGGEIVELAAGTGWWSALLATKGDLHADDASGALLDRARDRLLAHRLRAHIHVRDPWAPPDRHVDAVVAPFALGQIGSERRAAFATVAAAWLRPGGLLAVLEAVDDPATKAVPGVVLPSDLGAEPLARLLREAGLIDVEVQATGRFFVLAVATARGGARRP